VVYTGKTTQGQNFPEFIEDWKYTCSRTGWSNTEILLRWFYDIFVPETKPSDDALWRTLVLDQHKTHITAAFMKKAYMNKVWLIWLPSHSSHITQPLDLAIFGPLKRYYRQQTSAMETYEATSNRQKQIFMEAYKVSPGKAFSQENVRQAFRGTGIYPVDAEKAIARLQPKQRRQLIQNLPTTPPIQTEDGDCIFATPSSSRNIEKLLLKVNWSLENVERDIRLILQKCGKSLDRKISTTAFQEKEITLQRAKIAALKPSG
jgi:4-hydroxybenzoate polyprenyltransferase